MSVTPHEFDADQKRILDKVEKLLRLAARNTSQEEAASATAMAQELLTKYNLDMSMVNADQDKSAVREQMKLLGGMYEFQREIWRSVSELNFCLYWHMVNRKWKVVNKVDKWDGVKRQKDVLAKEFVHYVVGRVVNVRSTKYMAEYLLQAVERAVNERWHYSQRWAREAVAYREGIADTLINKLNARRRQMENEERERRKKQMETSGVDTKQALTIADFKKQERDANMDTVMGEGWSARKAAERAEDARKEREAEQAYTVWAAANPEEAAKEAAKQRAEDAKRSKRSTRRSFGTMSEKDKRSGGSSYWQGREAGEKISIDTQVSDRPSTAPKRIGSK